jgi:hypothetical protein
MKRLLPFQVLTLYKSKRHKHFKRKVNSQVKKESFKRDNRRWFFRVSSWERKTTPIFLSLSIILILIASKSQLERLQVLQNNLLPLLRRQKVDLKYFKNSNHNSSFNYLPQNLLKIISSNPIRLKSRRPLARVKINCLSQIHWFKNKRKRSSCLKNKCHGLV